MTDFDALMPEETEDEDLLMGDGKSTVVGMVLDRSGSMQDMWTEAKGAYNGQIEELRDQRAADDEILMVGTVFDTIVDVVLDCVPVQDAEDLPREILPRGCTALYDAIGETLTKMQATKVENDDKAYLLVVITDGCDNASTKTDPHRLSDMLKELEKSGEWTVVFIGSDVDALANASAMGFGANTHALDPSAKGLEAVGTSLRSTTGAYYGSRTRGVKSCANFTDTMAKAEKEAQASD